MRANITGENDERIGLYVYDSNDVEHWIEMEFDGEIKYHEQDGYPDDPHDRTLNERGRVLQARDFARHHVWQETEYEPFPVEKKPSRNHACSTRDSGATDRTVP